jgi:hypothetical protein
VNDFWVSSGHHLVDHDAQGRLVVTDALIKAWLARPEVMPPDEACIVERAVHQRLLRSPRDAVPADEIAAMQDRDARENWRHLIQFRDHLLAHPSLEAAYVALARAPRVTTPPLFLNQLVHLVLRNVLDGETDAYVLRAAETFFRPQRVSTDDQRLLLADQDLVDGTQADMHAAPLLALFGDATAKTLDVLTADTATLYAGRSDAFDMALDFRLGEPGRAAFARVIERWVEALLGVRLEVTPVARIDDDQWAWFVGLDAEATTIGNALWRGEPPPDGGAERLVALFEARARDPREFTARVGDKPVSLLLAMSNHKIVRVKPQNLIAALPLASTATAN